MGTYTRRVIGAGLVVGYLSLLAAVVTAHNAPATGYELSLYAATPRATWIGLAVAATFGLFAAFAAGPASRLRGTGLLLLGCAGITLTSIPVLRGYRYYGAGDSLTHLGWAREIAAGTLSPTDLLYPGVHSIAVIVSTATGTPVSLAMQYVVLVAFPAVFLLAVPLVVRLATDARWAYPVGLGAALLFVPINNISVHPAAHPTSQAILFLPVALLLALTYAFDPSVERLPSSSESADPLGTPAVTDGSGRVLASGVGVLTALISAGIVLIHPQQALNVTLVFAAVALLQIVHKRRGDESPIAGHRWLGLQTALIAGMFLLWTPRFERATGSIRFTVTSILTGTTTTGTVVTSKAASLTAIGGSLTAVFFKLFFVGSVLSVVAGVVLLVTLSGRVTDGSTDAAIRYLGAALVPLSGAFAVVFAVGAGDMYFRYQGFIMVFVTVIAAVGIAVAADRLELAAPTGTGRVLVVAFLLVLAPMAAIGYHTSPYMYQPSAQVTDSQLSGYGSAFEHRRANVSFTGIRGGPQRYVDSYYGSHRARTALAFPGYESRIPPAVFASGAYGERFDVPRYFVFTRASYEREVVLYDGLRYPERGFRSLETTPTIDRVRSSDGFRQYLFSPDDAEE